MINEIKVRKDIHPGIQVFVEEDQIVSDISYDSNDFNDSFANHSPLIVYYGELAARAETQVAIAKTDLERTEAEIIKLKREIYEAKGVKAAENRLEKEVLIDPRYIDAQTRLRDAKYVQSLLSVICTALDHRRSMLMQHARSSISNAYGEMRLVN